MKNITIVVGIVLIGVLAVLLLSGIGMMNGYGSMMGGYSMLSGNSMMSGYGNQFDFGFHFTGMIISLVTWTLIITTIILLVTWLVRDTNALADASGRSLDEVLKTRYARGEMTREQFEQTRRDLGL